MRHQKLGFPDELAVLLPLDGTHGDFAAFLHAEAVGLSGIHLGVGGAVAACLGAIIPSIAIILLIALFFLEYKDNPVVERIFRGIRPCVVALILSPAVKMFIHAKVNWNTAFLPLATVILIYFFHVSPVYIIIATIIGSVGFAFYSQKQLNKPCILLCHAI